MVFRKASGLALNSFKSPFFYTMLDQGLNFISLFVFSAVISRFLTQTDFGIFSIYVAFASLIAALFSPLLIDASTVFISRKEGDRTDWGRSAAAISYSVLVLLIAVEVIALLWFGLGTLTLWLGVLLSELAVASVNLLRRLGYAENRPKQGAKVSATALVANCLILVAIVSWLPPSLEYAILARVLSNVAIVAVFSSRKVYAHLKPGFAAAFADLTEFFRYSRSYILASVLFWITSSLTVVLVGYFISAADAGAFRVSQIMVLPAAQITAALFQLLLPRTVAVIDRSKPVGLQRITSLSLILITPVLIYCVLVSLFATQLLGLAFGQQYAGYSHVVIGLAIFSLFESAKQVVVILIYAYDEKSIFLKHRLLAVVLFVIGIFPAAYVGSISAFVAVNVLSSLALFVYLCWALRHSSAFSDAQVRK